MGKDKFVWWFGFVESNADPLSLGRCRIRIQGWHNDSDIDLPTEALPWAYPITPITNAAVGGIGISPVGPQPGTRIFGFFLDGETGQQPVMLGTVPGESVYENRNSLEYGSTPWQPTYEKDFNTIFGKETDCSDGYTEDTTQTNVPVPDPRTIQISPGEWIIPYSGFVSSKYGVGRGNTTHKGVDICPAGFYPQTSAGAAHLKGRLRGPTGLPVLAAADGVVTYIWTANKAGGGKATTYDKNRLGGRSYGNAIAIKHTLSTGTYTTIYAHLGVSQDAGKDAPGAGISVKKGQKVKKGQQIGTVGRSHCWDSLTHLHFEVRIGDALPKANNHIDPGRIFPQLGTAHKSFISWADSQSKYNIEKLPFTLSDAPVVAGEGPKE